MKLNGSASVKQNRHTRRERSGDGLFSMSSTAGVSASVTAWDPASSSLGARSRDHTRGRELSTAISHGQRLALLPVFGWLLPRFVGSLARSLVSHERLARRRRASVSVASRTLLSPGNSGYVATALYNGGRTWNRLAKVARVPDCCVENREYGRENAVYLDRGVFAQWRRANAAG